MIFLFTIVVIFAIGIVIAGYLYAEECSRLRKKLLRLGVKKEEIASFSRKFSLFYLQDILYEKETELAEECFLTVEKDI